MEVVGGVDGWGFQSNFRVQPNNWVEVVLRCVGVGVVPMITTWSPVARGTS